MGPAADITKKTGYKNQQEEAVGNELVKNFWAKYKSKKLKLLNLIPLLLRMGTKKFI